MNHPTKEELLSLLYDEVPASTRTELAEHLRTCASCRAQYDQWQETQRDLASWKLPAAHRPVFSFAATAKWAAALFMIGIGFAFGRLTGTDAEALRTSIQQEVQQSVARQQEQVRQSDRKEFIAMLRDIEEHRLADYTQLRKDLETVAVLADEKLTRTERVLSEANLFAQSDANSTSK